MLKDLKEWFSSISGKKLNYVYGLIYIYDSEDFSHPQELQVIFEMGLVKKISCSSDGSTLLLQDSPMVECDLGEYGKQVIKDISDISVFRNVIGEELQGLKVISSDVEQSIIGLSFHFSNSKFINILTIGDEISFYRNIPINIMEEEGINFLSIDE